MKPNNKGAESQANSKKLKQEILASLDSVLDCLINDAPIENIINLEEEEPSAEVVITENESRKDEGEKKDKEDEDEHKKENFQARFMDIVESYGIDFIKKVLKKEHLDKNNESEMKVKKLMYDIGKTYLLGKIMRTYKIKEKKVVKDTKTILIRPNL